MERKKENIEPFVCLLRKPFLILFLQVEVRSIKSIHSLLNQRKFSHKLHLRKIID